MPEANQPRSSVESPVGRVWKPNVTVAAIVHQDDRFLLVEECTRNGVRYNNPAGHLEPGESLEQAVVRETLEETAYRFKPSALLGLYMSRNASSQRNGEVTYLRVAFVGTVSDHDPARALDEGIIRAHWMSIEEVRAVAHLHRSPMVLRCIEDFLAGNRLPLSAIHTDSSVFL